jgi:hypothetical protein
VTRRVPAIAGADAHARVGYRQASDPYEDRVLARLPPYEVSFRAFVNHVILSQPLTRDAAADATLILAAIREGHMFTSIDSLAGLGAFEAKATGGGAAATPGAYLDVMAPVAIEATIAAPSGTTLTVLRNGEPVYETREPALRIDIGRETGVYRIEARLPTQSGATPVPWLLSNPIYIGMRDAHRQAAAVPPLPPVTVRVPIATEAWTAEASPGSTSVLASITLEDGTPAIEWRFGLAGGTRGAQYAAMSFPIATGLTAGQLLQVRARSDQPRRLWAQVRAASETGGQRWGRSFYVAPELTETTLHFGEFRPFDGAAAAPSLARVDSLLLVVDTTNTAPGSAGRIAFTDLWLAR